MYQFALITMKKILIILFGILLLTACNRVSGTYVSDGAGQGLVLLFKIQDRNTLVGESQWNNAIFRKAKETNVPTESAQ